MKVGYIRVSTQEQNTVRQEVLMQALDVEQVFIDRMSGKNLARPELQKLLAFVRTGDCVIVESISRFARNTRDLLELIERLQSKQVQFVSKKEAIDTTTPTGKFMLTVFGAVAELEREYILQRQREGIAIAKENGVYKGRKPIVCAGFDSVPQGDYRSRGTETAGTVSEHILPQGQRIRETNRKGGRNMIWYVLGFLLTAALLLIGGMDYAVK